MYGFITVNLRTDTEYSAQPYWQPLPATVPLFEVPEAPSSLSLTCVVSDSLGSITVA